MATQDLWQSISPPAPAPAGREASRKRLRQPRGSAPEGIEPIEHSGLLPVRAERISTPGNALKRTIDLSFSSAMLVLLAPVLVIIALAIRLDSPGPVFYISERIGRQGRSFRCFKFRTMVSDAERQQQRMLHLNERDGVLFKIARDPRVTRVGRLLRKYSLDELPQFFNVLRGEMSVVGPRPPVASEVREYTKKHLQRLAVRPGITGLWQTQSRHDPSFESYVSLDLAYIEHWSVVLDLKIIVQTVGVIFAGTGI